MDADDAAKRAQRAARFALTARAPSPPPAAAAPAAGGFGGGGGGGAGFGGGLRRVPSGLSQPASQGEGNGRDEMEGEEEGE